MQLLKKFVVIITDHRTKKEILKRIMSSFNQKNLDRGIESFKGTMDQFSKEMEKLHNSMNDGKIIDLDKQFWGTERKSTHDIFWGKRSNTDIW